MLQDLRARATLAEEAKAETAALPSKDHLDATLAEQVSLQR